MVGAKFLLGAVIAFASSSVVMGAEKVPKAVTQLRAQYSRPVEQLIPLLTVKGDSLDPVISITTDGMTVYKSSGLIRTTFEPAFLRAFIDKKTGATLFQIYHRAVYDSSGWYFLRKASFAGLNGLENVDVVRVASNVSCSSPSCTYFEDVAFELPQSLVDELAKSYSPQQPLVALKYRLFGQSGDTIDSEIPLNEIAAFSRKVGETRAGLGLGPSAFEPIAKIEPEPEPTPVVNPASPPLLNAPGKRASVKCETCRPN